MKKLKKWTSLTVTTSLLLFGGVASANFTGNDTSNFNPSVTGLDFVTVLNSETLKPGYFNFILFVNQARNTLPSTKDTFGNTIDTNDTITFGDMGLAFGLTERIEVAGSLSYLLRQDVDQVVSGAQFTATGLNELKVFGKYRLLDRNPIGAALVVSFNMNQAENNPFVGSNAGPTTNIEAVIDTELGQTNLALNLGYRFRHKGDSIEGSVFEPLGNTAIGSAAASYLFPEIKTKLIGEIIAAKSTQDTTAEESGQISSEALLGLKYLQNKHYAWNIGGGTRLSEGLFTPDWRVYVGLNISFNVFARNQTSIEQVPPVPSPPTIAPVSQPVTAPAPIVYQGYSPREVEEFKNIPFDELAKRHEFRLRTTIPDQDFKGEKPPFEIIRLQNFDFEFGSSTIKAENRPQLDKLVTYLATRPQVLKIRIEGHTDSVGTPERNRLRSLDRAESVKKYLQSTRLLDNVPIETAGYGADSPISENSTSEGRKQNRRVEIRILRNINVEK